MFRCLLLSCLLSIVLAFPATDFDNDVFTEGIDKRFRVWPTIREKKELVETADDLRQARERLVNGQMLKQPLLRFDILWRKFSGKRRQDYQ